MSAVRVRLILLDPFLLRQGDQLLAGFDYARLHQLLAYLVLHQAIPITRQQLAFVFWPDATHQQALKNLRTLLTRLRQALPDADHFIVRKIVGEPWFDPGEHSTIANTGLCVAAWRPRGKLRTI